jgi:hypothetical protein
MSEYTINLEDLKVSVEAKDAFEARKIVQLVIQKLVDVEMWKAAHPQIDPGHDRKISR